MIVREVLQGEIGGFVGGMLALYAILSTTLVYIRNLIVVLLP